MSWTVFFLENDAEVNFLKFQQETENKLADIALTRGGIQDSASVVMDKLNQELNDSIASLAAQREKMKKNTKKHKKTPILVIL